MGSSRNQSTALGLYHSWRFHFPVHVMFLLRQGTSIHWRSNRRHHLRRYFLVPHAANLINPGTWGNTDQITLEFSRIVLVVQCFAVGVELPKYYMEKHWRSVVFLLIPVMTFWVVDHKSVYLVVDPAAQLAGKSVLCCLCYCYGPCSRQFRGW